MQNYEQEQVNFFSKLYKKHGMSHKTLHWISKETQSIRYIELLRIFTLCDTALTAKILDFGCGLGHMYKFLKDNNFIETWKIDYTGVDINQKFILEAKKLFPEAHFAVKDESIYSERFDFVLCSGIFNLKFSNEFDIESYYKTELKKIFAIANCGVSVNFQSKEGIKLLPRNSKGCETEKFYFHDSQKVFQNLKEIADKVQINSGYLPNDFTVYLLK